jgi:HEAT repeat protein
MGRSRWSVLLLVPLLLSASDRAAEPAPADEEPVYQGKSMTEWVGDLKEAANARKRSAAVRAMAVFGPRKAVVSALAAVIETDDGKGEGNEAIRDATRTLGQFGPKAKEALPALRARYERLSGDPDERKRRPFLRGAVAEALILIDEHPGPDLASLLLEALKNSDAGKRRDIVVRLGKLGAEAAKTTVPALIAILEDPAEEARRPGAWASESSNPGENAADVRLEAVQSLGRIGPAARPAIHALTLALKKAAPAKYDVVQQMEVSDKPVGSSGAKVRTLTFALVTGDEPMLQACAEALGRIRPEAKGTVGALRLALRDSDEGVRWAALCALLDCGCDGKELTPILVPFLRDKDAALRQVAMKALGKCGSPAKEVLPHLTAALQDDNATVREAAVKALGERGSEASEAVSPLIGALEDSETAVRSAAVESLGKIGGADREVVPALVAALGDKEMTVMGAAGMELAKRGSSAKAAIPPLVAMLQESEPTKRGGACLILARFGPTAKEAIPALEKMARGDSEEFDRLAAHTALAKIDSSRVKETVRLLSAALGSKDKMVREAAVECLAAIGPEARDAVPTLRGLGENSADFSLKSGIDAALELIQPDVQQKVPVRKSPD